MKELIGLEGKEEKGKSRMHTNKGVFQGGLERDATKSGRCCR